AVGDVFSRNCLTKRKAVDWSKLPAYLLRQIAELLVVDVADYVHFRAVCTTWRSAAVDPRRRPPQLPWLLLHHDRTTNRLYFFSFSDAKTHSIRLPDRACDCHICLSCDGWLVLKKASSRICLLNPLSRTLIELPPVFKLLRAPQLRRSYQDITIDIMKRYNVRAIAMSSNPRARQHWTIQASFRFMPDLPVLASLRLSDWYSWTLIDHSTMYDDVICIKETFYTVNEAGQVAVFNSRLEKMAMVGSPTRTSIFFRSWRLVESSGELLVLRNVLFELTPTVDKKNPNQLPVYSTDRVEIFRLKSIAGKLCLVTAKCLDDQILFVGLGRSFARHATSYPPARRNSMFLAEEYDFMRNDNLLCRIESGEYNFGDEIMEPLPYDRVEYESIGYTSIWHSPSL
ncbi:unnamed protein product, partial [Musa textilis]